MNIAHLLPYSAYFPANKHNGRYEWALRLAQMQAEQGHDVTIYSAPESGTGLQGIKWKSSPNDLHNRQLNNASLVQTAFQQPVYDIYHSHFDSLHFEFANLTDRPVVFTQHWFPTKAISTAQISNTKHNVIAVPPTKYMFQENKRLGIKTVEAIHHGIDLNLFKPSHQQISDRLIFVGRIAPNKGVLQAVEIANANKLQLDIVGKINDADKEYWQQITPLIDGERIKYLGPKTQREVAQLFGQAKAFLFPTQSPEAFGQVIVEAQACGTPVVISDVGASGELVDDGKSGFVIKSKNTYKDALKKLDSLDRKYCRTFAEQFSLPAMFDQYETLYNQLVK